MVVLAFRHSANEACLHQDHRLRIPPAAASLHTTQYETDLEPASPRAKSAHTRLLKPPTPTGTSTPSKDPPPSAFQAPDSYRPSNQTRQNNSTSANHHIVPHAATAADGVISEPTDMRPVYTYSEDGRQLGPYKIERMLGQGAFGHVMLGVDTRTSRKVALKMMDKDMLTESERVQVCVQREIEICTTVKHPHIVRCIQTFETSSQLVLVLEYIAGGDLFDYIVQGKCTVEDARDIFYELTSAVAYLHSRRICHRDLKLENVLLDTQKHVHIADFGLATFFDPETPLTARLGSEDYSSPEIIQGLPYNPVCTDSWALGVILYTMLAKELPFQPGPNGDVKPMYHRIARGEYRWPKHVNVPDDAKDLVKGLLQSNPKRRMTASDCLTHAWLSECRSRKGSLNGTGMKYDGSSTISAVTSNYSYNIQKLPTPEAEDIHRAIRRPSISIPVLGSYRNIHSAPPSLGEAGSDFLNGSLL
ncbi:hypothetical protein SeLEV6574_g06739 [Synchytrium endobioticum]|uniref:Protein kinase domain-containing protein n=1 Tax=Synchytrium endobioticum TaxID=286115 RepID=A0A507CKG9_9FUNG|nr:hypothetical protein SeLEV6574_g06739 [Synchytrium endobioticum]